jgi:hypothetical protein
VLLMSIVVGGLDADGTGWCVFCVDVGKSGFIIYRSSQDSCPHIPLYRSGSLVRTNMEVFIRRDSLLGTLLV